MVIRISDKTQNYSKVTKLLVKPNLIKINLSGSNSSSNSKRKIMDPINIYNK